MFEISVTKEELLSTVSSFYIFTRYCSNFKYIGKHFSSDVRPDKDPSCIIDYIGDDLMYSDFGEGIHLRAIAFVMYKYDLSYREALDKIWMDFKEERYDVITSQQGLNYRNKESKPTIIKIIKRVDKSGNPIYTKSDLEYWNSFYWTESMLRQSKTWSISHYFINNKKTNGEDVVYNVNSERAYSYDYYYNNGVFRRKIYFPDRINGKWISNVDNTTVQLVDVMPKSGDVLFITSSKKDAGIFWRMNIDRIFPSLTIHGVAPNSETCFLSNDWILKMRSRWKRLVIWFDSDETGIKNAKKFSEMHNIEYGHNNSLLKDPSDFSKKNGILEFKKLIQNTINI